MPHVHDKIDFTAEVFIVYDGKVLLRIHDKYKMWLAVGGHIELDEDPNQAAIREVREEVGLTVQLVGPKLQVEHEGQAGYHELIPPAFLNRHRISDTHQHISFIYFARSQSDAIVEEEDEKSGGVHWFTREELETGTYPVKDSIKKYALAALAVAA